MLWALTAAVVPPSDRDALRSGCSAPRASVTLLRRSDTASAAAAGCLIQPTAPRPSTYSSAARMQPAAMVAVQPPEEPSSSSSAKALRPTRSCMLRALSCCTISMPTMCSCSRHAPSSRQQLVSRLSVPHAPAGAGGPAARHGDLALPRHSFAGRAAQHGNLNPLQALPACHTYTQQCETSDARMLPALLLYPTCNQGVNTPHLQCCVLL